jgi:purine-nucleoside phosphorylase
MYKSFTSDEYRQHFNLSTDYKIKAFISFGSWNLEKEFNNTLEALKELGIDCKSKNLEGFLSNILEIKIDNKIYWFAVVYGGAILSEYLHLACIFGSKQSIHIGSCGGLYPDMNSLDLLIPTWTYGLESSASMYDRENTEHKYFADENLSKIIEAKLDKEYKIWKGPVVSCHAMLGETYDDVQNWSKQGYYGIEMETATVFAVSKHFNVQSASLLYVGDNLIKGQTVQDESHSKEKEQREELKKYVHRIAIEMVLNI